MNDKMPDRPEELISLIKEKDIEAAYNLLKRRREEQRKVEERQLGEIKATLYVNFTERQIDEVHVEKQLIMDNPMKALLSVLEQYREKLNVE